MFFDPSTVAVPFVGPLFRAKHFLVDQISGASYDEPKDGRPWLLPRMTTLKRRFRLSLPEISHQPKRMGLKRQRTGTSAVAPKLSLDLGLLGHVETNVTPSGDTLEHHLVRGSEGDVWIASSPEGQTRVIKIVSGVHFARYLKLRPIFNKLAGCSDVVQTRSLEWDFQTQCCFQSMDLYDCDLLQYMHNNCVSKQLCEAEAAQYFGHIARAVLFCHQNGIIHRDLKLENILLDVRNRVAHLGDFGSAVFAERKLHECTSGSVSSGSVAYAAPELVRRTPRLRNSNRRPSPTSYHQRLQQGRAAGAKKHEEDEEEVEGDDEVDEEGQLSSDDERFGLDEMPLRSSSECCSMRTDIWSLGVLLYGMLTGDAPWNIADAQCDERFACFAHCGGAFLFERQPELSEEARQLVLGMLMLDPKKRLTIHEIMDMPWLQRHGHRTQARQNSKKRNKNV